MENISRALILAGSMLLFVLGFTYSIYLINKLSTTSETVLETISTTNYYDNIEADVDATKERIVGIDTVISTLYRYYKESYAVKILDESGNVIQLFDTSIESKVASESKRKNSSLSDSIYMDTSNPAYMHTAPWTSDNKYAMDRINYFLNGTRGYINNVLVDYSAFGGFIKNYGNKEFVESFIEYAYSGETVTTLNGLETITGSTREKDKIIITYQVCN